jgi:hypothetical protein
MRGVSRVQRCCLGVDDAQDQAAWRVVETRDRWVNINYLFVRTPQALLLRTTQRPHPHEGLCV